MRIATYTNARGDSLSFRPGSPFVISDIQGLGDVDATVQLQQAPYQDGGSYIDSLLSPRAISFRVWIDGKDDSDISRKRSQLSSLFNPKLGPGIFEYRYGDQVRQIAAVAEHVPSFPTGFDSRGRRHQVAVIDLLCPNPYWRSLTVTEEPAFEPLFEFPFEGKFEFGVTRNDRLIYNDGDAPTSFNIDFYGPADRPIIENLTTGEFIRINKRLEEGQTLKIDTTDGVKSVTYVDEDGTETNVFHWIDLSSTFFKLGIGDNDITCHCAISNNQRDFDIYYSKLYNAI